MTGGNWSIGRNTGCVVSDVSSTEEDKRTGHGDSEYYGGVLICESIRTPEDAKLIALAPALLEAVKEFIMVIKGDIVPNEQTLPYLLQLTEKLK